MAGTALAINRNLSTEKGLSHNSFSKSYSDHRSRKMQGLLKKIKKSPLTRPRASSSPLYDIEKCHGNDVGNVAKYESEQDRLRRCEKDIKSALQYYKVILEKGILQKLPGTATVVLESVIGVEKLVDDSLCHSSDEQEKYLQSLKENLNRNVTNLILLSDDVLFDSTANVQLDKASAFRAVDSVLQSVHELCEYITPRLQKLNLNAEFANYCTSSSSHSSSNSLEDVRETAILENGPGNNSRKNSGNTSIVQSVSEREYRDSGIASEYSDLTGTTSSYASRSSIGSEHCNINKETPPAKPPLPSTGNRMYYGKIRKAKSQPDTIQYLTQQGSPSAHLKARPNSDFQTKTKSPFLDHIDKRASTTTSGSSRSSFESCDSFSTSPRRENFISEQQLQFDQEGNSANEPAEIVDLDGVGMRDETYNQIQKYSARYEMLTKSSLSLFSEDGDTVFGASSPRNSQQLNSTSPGPDGPPVPPKKRSKNFLQNYFTFVENYNACSNGERPISFYDNCPVPRAHQIDESQLLEGIEEENPPQLPPKIGGKKRSGTDSVLNTSLTEGVEVTSFEPAGVNRSSPIVSRGQRRASQRDSSAAYQEDHVTPLDREDVSDLLVFRDDGKGMLLCAGTADALLVYATECKESNTLFYEAFLATYRTFISPQQLMCKLVYRANLFRDRAGCRHISHGAVLLLVHIIDELFEALDKSLFDNLRGEVHRLLNHGDIQLAKDLRDKMVNFCLKIQTKLLTKPVYESNDEFSIFDFRSSDLAEQMTLLDYDYFSKIELPEILAWGKEQSEALSPNLTEFIAHFNNMSYWCRTIVLRESKQQERERLFKKFLKIMKHCRRLNNFSSFLAILSALDASPVRRLEWPKLFSEVMEEAVLLIDSSSAFKTYRQALSEAKPPCIPYLGLILQDITFIHLGNPNDLPEGQVNFVKRWQQYNILATVRRFKEVPYDIHKDEQILQFFNEYEDHMGEEDLWDKSQQIKPKGSSRK